ncbi:MULTISPECIES: FixH family protein [Bacillaceae]|uniref:FixH family protein n=1 Tax=Bacillaceae TaxID=186817 RepID=UPI001BDEFF3D|nr:MULTISPECIES: FixH family protein [Bacillaceae]MDX8362028.1 FixH family protein [Cytobacillus sp. IB215316]
MKKLLVLVAVLIIGLVGCSKTEEPHVQLELIEVVIQTKPAVINPQDEVEISATVTQGEGFVNDADSVTFEIKKMDEEESEEVEGKLKGDGVYFINKTFSEAGVYAVTAHVTARGLHTMPTEDITVGSADVQQESESVMNDDSSESMDMSDEDSHENMESESSDHEEGNHGEGLKIHFMSMDNVKLNTEVALTAHLQLDNNPLSKAEVQFEVWQDGQEKHDYIDAIEGDAGEYKALKTFDTIGEYKVTVHMKKDELHDHIDKTIHVVK